MNEITFKYKEKRIQIFFEYEATNNHVYQSVARELNVEPQKINLIGIKNNNDRIETKYFQETVIVEMIDEGQVDNIFSKRQRSGYVGLSNNDFYYLNSILQSLYMIIPFRNIVYSWNWKQYVESKKENKKSILKERSAMRQFQFLFTELERMNAKFLDPYEFFTEKIKQIQYTFPSDFFSSTLQAILQDLQNTQFVGVFLETFCLRVETTTFKNFATIDFDCSKFNFNDGVASFCSNIVKYQSFPQYLFIHPQRFTRDYVHISKNSSPFVYPNSFNFKDIVKKIPNDVNYELLQVSYHKGYHWSSDSFGLVAKNELDNQWIHFSDKLVYLTSKDECHSFYSDNDERESAIFLVYKKIDTNNTNLQLTKIPQKLISDTQKEENKRQERLVEKNRKRDYSTMSVYLGKSQGGDKPWKLEISESFKSVSFSRSGDIASIAKQAAQEWKISEKESTFRIRKYNSKYKVAVDCYRENESFMMSNISVTDSLVLEVYPEPNHRFSDNKGSCYILGVIAYNKENNTFSSLEYIPFETVMQFSELKVNLEKITGIPASTMKIYYESNHDSQEKELNCPNKNLRETPLFDGHKLYVEDYDPTNQYSPCLMELENVKNQTEIFYNSNITLNDFEKTVFDKFVKIDKRVSVYDLLQLISMELNVDVDELKLFNIFERDRERVIAEVKNMSLSLTEIAKNKAKVMVYLEKTKPQALSDVVLSFLHYQPDVFSYLETSPFEELPKDNENINQKPKLYTEAFELTVKCNILITDLRKLIFEQLEKIKIEKPKSPFHIRLREIYAYFPSTIFPNSDKLTLSDCVENIFFHNKPIAFQILDVEEPVNSRTTVAPILQQWNPKTFTFGPRIEFIFDREMAIEDLRTLISKKYNIENVGLAKSNKIEIFHSDIDDLFWDPNVPLFIANKKTKAATLSSSPLFLGDGQVLFFRDNNQSKMQLGPKDKSKLEIFLKHHKAISFVTQKEKNKK